MSIRTLVIDDEEPARVRLRGMLEQIAGLEIVGEAQDGEEAVRRIDDMRPDLVFLDIEMPGLTGMEVAARLAPPRPRIIFCTAYDQYAIEAFEQHATGYLLKPVNRSRLARAVERVRSSLDEQRDLLREADAARETQERLLPQRLPPMVHLDYFGLSRPARAVGGDYYDFLPLPQRRLGVALGDVSGKGMFAGLLVASLQARLQSAAPRHGDGLSGLVDELNTWMTRSTAHNRYATLFYGLFDDERSKLTYVNAGHLPPLLVREDQVLRLEANGPVVGALADACYRQDELELRPGDTFCVFSDGITEATDGNGDEFETERLVAVLRRHLALDAECLARRVLAEVEEFVGAGAQRDDMSLIVGKVR